MVWARILGRYAERTREMKDASSVPHPPSRLVWLACILGAAIAISCQGPAEPTPPKPLAQPIPQRRVGYSIVMESSRCPTLPRPNLPRFAEIKSNSDLHAFLGYDPPNTLDIESFQYPVFAVAVGPKSAAGWRLEIEGVFLLGGRLFVHYQALGPREAVAPAAAEESCPTRVLALTEAVQFDYAGVITGGL